MPFLTRLFLLFVGVPILELFILVQVGQWLGVWPTLGLVVVTGFLGAALARAEGLKALWRIQGELARGQLPADAMLDGFAILLGGMLLLTPGILTDLLGLSFLFPLTRRPLMAWIRKGLERRLKAGTVRITHVWGPQGGGFSAWGGMDEQGGETSLRPGEIVIESDEASNP